MGVPTIPHLSLCGIRVGGACLIDSDHSTVPETWHITQTNDQTRLLDYISYLVKFIFRSIEAQYPNACVWLGNITSRQAGTSECWASRSNSRHEDILKQLFDWGGDNKHQNYQTTQKY